LGRSITRTSEFARGKVLGSVDSSPAIDKMIVDNTVQKVVSTPTYDSPVNLGLPWQYTNPSNAAEFAPVPVKTKGLTGLTITSPPIKVTGPKDFLGRNQPRFGDW